MATVKVEVTYAPKKETLSQALASLLTEKPEPTETYPQMSLFDTPAPVDTPTAQTPVEIPQEPPVEPAATAPDAKSLLRRRASPGLTYELLRSRSPRIISRRSKRFSNQEVNYGEK